MDFSSTSLKTCREKRRASFEVKNLRWSNATNKKIKPARHFRTHTIRHVSLSFILINCWLQEDKATDKTFEVTFLAHFGGAIPGSILRKGFPDGSSTRAQIPIELGFVENRHLDYAKIVKIMLVKNSNPDTLFPRTLTLCIFSKILSYFVSQKPELNGLRNT
ncbi:MAG: hypothetical protein ACE5HS_06090 [bacterium]